ncbi:MAG: carbamoyl-phosphate synthase domain-containing protein [Bacteroidota bacterium]
MLCMTAPQIGNYGVNPADVESRGIQMAGMERGTPEIRHQRVSGADQW